MFVEVPAPPCTTSTTNWSSKPPRITSAQARSIASARSKSSTPSSRIVRAAACFTAPSASINGRCCASVTPLTGEFSTARAVWIPQYTPAGIVRAPSRSCSTRTSALISRTGFRREHVERGPRQRDGAVTDGALGPLPHTVVGELPLVVERRQRIDPDIGMDRGYRLGDVAHVGRRTVHPARLFSGSEVSAQRRSIGAVCLQRPFVVSEFRVRLALGRDGHFASAGQRTGFEAAKHLLLHRFQFIERFGADVPPAAGALGNRVGRLASIGHDAVHAHARGELLA